MASTEEGHSRSGPGGAAPDDVSSLLEQHLPGLMAFVRLRLGARLRARESTIDLVQSACREVLADLGSQPHRDEASFKRWLYVAAERKVIDRARFHARSRRDAGRDGPALGDLSDDEVARLSCGYASLRSPSQHAMAREDLDRVERAFGELSETYKEVILFSRFLGFSHQEIAEKTGRSEGAVSVLLHRAITRLGILVGPAPLG